MGANAGAPNDKVMQMAILRESLEHLVSIQTPGRHIPLNYQYTAQI